MKTSPMRWMVLCLCLCGVGVVFARDKVAERLEKVYQQVKDSVVQVKYVQEFNMMSSTHKMEGSACGLLVDKDGLVMFSGVVVAPPDFGRGGGGWEREKPKDYKIILADDSELPADYVGMDQDSNMAFVRIRQASAQTNLHAVKFSGKRLSLGQEVVVVGLLPKRYTPNRKFQTARINVEITKPAHMYGATLPLIEYLGGPVVTLEGDVVGVVGMESDLGMDESSLMSAMSSISGMGGISSMFGGYVIPGQSFEALLENPPKDEEVKRGWLGVTLQALDKDTAEYMNVPGRAGIYITRVMKGSPADQAGVQAEDVLMELDGQPLDVKKEEDIVVFQRAMRKKKPGESVVFTIYRDNQKQEKTVVLGDSPKSRVDAEKAKSAPLGLTVRELVLDDVLEMNLSDDQKGVVVLLVESGGAGEIAEVAPMDVIQQVDGKPVGSLAQWKEIYQQLRADKKDEVVLLVLRDGNETKFLRLKPDWTEQE